MVMKMAEAIGIKTVPCALIKTDGSDLELGCDVMKNEKLINNFGQRIEFVHDFKNFHIISRIL